MAVREDMLQFERNSGSFERGCHHGLYVTFEAVHLGVSDVFYDQAEGMWRMCYVDGGYEESPLPTSPEKLFRFESCSNIVERVIQHALLWVLVTLLFVLEV